ncbi:hypothetical protein ABZ642_40715 [Streptomyces sp. NPDC007157]|uniref:hypothetical protein n=1 Tax=Streptomyces sp. NPDC007157 TaxID=3154681 RepID=UPI0034054051
MLDPQAMPARFGAWAVLVVIFAETAVPAVGVFLPGDTLLPPAGLARSLSTPGAARLAPLNGGVRPARDAFAA